MTHITLEDIAASFEAVTSDDQRERHITNILTIARKLRAAQIAYWNNRCGETMNAMITAEMDFDRMLKAAELKG